VLVVGKHASMRFGGEATLPLLYFRRLRDRGVQAWMLVHRRTADELREILGPDEIQRVHFVPDTAFNRFIWKFEKFLPDKIGEPLLDTLRYVETQRVQRKMARQLVRDLGITVVHESAPISAKRPSAMYGLAAPVVIGPLCGGMTYPPAFKYMQGRASRAIEFVGRLASGAFNRLMPGKRRADFILVANDQTRRALPRGVKGKVLQVVESGVDLDVWKPVAESGTPAGGADDGQVRFVFLGRLVDWKGVNFLLEAFKTVADRNPNTRLQILGDGPLRQSLEDRARALGLTDRVEFTGWVSRAQGAEYLRRAHVMVMPSLRECGGTAILEAFAMGIPVIATRWGGPAHYVDDDTGIRVPPDTRDGFITGLADAMLHLAADPALRARMSAACLRRARSHYFDWQSKVDRLIEIYWEAIRGRQGSSTVHTTRPDPVPAPQPAASS
jgi:glycosyltransferase involved in cell wall biosynthesis